MTTVATSTFGRHPNGSKIHLYTMTNSHGWQVELTEMGAAIRAVRVPDREGKLVDVALCHGTFADSVKNLGNLGVVCGRVVGYISGAKFKLNNHYYYINSKRPEYAFNGGLKTFAHAIWHTNLQQPDRVTFTLTSPDGDQGFPGTLDVSITYTWDDEGTLSLDYKATSDADTIVNLSNSAYFNLDGQGADTIFQHRVTLKAPSYLPIDSNLCVTGEVSSVAGTSLDFTKSNTIGERLHTDNAQLRMAGGYDFDYVLAPQEGVRHGARVSSEKTGIVLDTYTDQPILHFYSGNNMLAYKGKNEIFYVTFGGFCLAAQDYSDAINQEAFPSTILREGDTYSQHTEYRFSVQ